MVAGVAHTVAIAVTPAHATTRVAIPVARRAGTVLRVALPHPLVLHKHYPLGARVVAAAVSGPVVVVGGRHVQVRELG